MDFGGMALLVTAIATLVTAIGSVIVSIYNNLKLKVVQTEVEGVAAHVVKVERATNGLKDELVATVRAASLAEGIKQGGEKERASHLTEGGAGR